MTAAPETGGEVLRISAAADRLTLEPGGLSGPPVDFPTDSRESALLLRRWEDEQDLAGCLPPGHEALWWGSLRHLFGVHLALVLVALRALEPVRERRPQRIEIRGPSAQVPFLARAAALLWPGVPVSAVVTTGRTARDYLRWYAFLAVRAGRAALGRARLARLPRRDRRLRVAIFQGELQWVEGRDKEMASTAEALRARDCEVITIASPSEFLGRNLRGLFSRPRDHIFSDFLRPSSRAAADGLAPPLAAGRFSHAGRDLTPLVAALLGALRPHDDLEVSDRGWTELIRRLSPDFILMAHEHYDRAVVGRAARAAGVRFGVVQHGILAEYSPLYVFPARAAASYPLPWRTFVYTQRDAEILSGLSIFSRDSLIVTGSTEWDVLRAQGETRRRRGGLRAQPGRLRLLFASQHGLEEAIVRGLLAGVANLKVPTELRVRLHPREIAAWRWKRAFAAFPAVDAHLSRNDALDADLAWCDLHATFASTCLMHAVVAGLPSVLLGAQEYPWREQFVTAGLAKKAGATLSFAAAVEAWSEPEGSRRFFLDRDRYLAASGLGQGSAGERIAAEIAVSAGPAI